MKPIPTIGDYDFLIITSLLLVKKIKKRKSKLKGNHIIIKNETDRPEKRKRSMRIWTNFLSTLGPHSPDYLPFSVWLTPHSV